MKKLVVGIALILILSIAINPVVFAETVNTLEEDNTSDILTRKNEVNTKLEEYTEKYDSESYGLVAYILHLVRIYSIPVCFIGIIVGALKQYVLGTRRLDMKHKGYGLIMTFVTLLVICQVLPLIFTLVVMGWRVN